ncbi:MAG TPA: flagellin [Bryobacteraceae bacterium]|nr:flagellin [Bryobacteraceae bacterium]
MSISIQTNVNSLVAQENLRVNSNFQSKTIQQLTSGYRINSSGDDAAGLAIANQFRSETAELTQGVRNANDGISQLQIMDGGMNNIGTMLDRLKTLATQSASGTFTGNRATLNSEYQTLVAEIDRQAQSVGLATGGHFAAQMGVYIGGGASNSGGADTANGSVTLDLTTAVVDSKALGLAASDFEVGSASTTGIAAGSNSSVATIATNANNIADTTHATFNISGPGFTSKAIDVDMSGQTDPNALASQINDQITTVANSDANFAAAGITASIKTDGNGVKSLVFSSTAAGFQVSAGSKMASALMGNFKVGGSTGEGADVAAKFTAASSVVQAAANETVGLKFIIDGVPQSVVNVNLLAADANAAATAAHVTGATLPAGVTASYTNGKLSFTGPDGKSLEVQVSGDAGNYLGLGSWQGGYAASTYTSAAAATLAAGTAVIEFSINGGDKVAVQLTNTNSTAQIAADIVAAAGANSTLKAAGITAVDDGGHTEVTISSGGVDFRYNIASRSAPTFDMQLSGVSGDGAGAASVGNLQAVTSTDTKVDATGTSESGIGTDADVFAFKALRNTNDAQSLTIGALDANGVSQSIGVNLNTTNADNLTDAVAAINAALQADPTKTLTNVVAVKELNAAGTAEGIRFVSSLPSFNVTIGKATNNTSSVPVGLYDDSTGAASPQGNSYASSQGGVLSIDTIQGAIQAVTALSGAVQQLGTAQAAVGKSQNQLTYAIDLANSQISNFSSAESQIRDADVAAEAANLTKAQVLQQATIAAMAQANSAPQAVLTLLRG